MVNAVAVEVTHSQHRRVLASRPADGRGEPARRLRPASDGSYPIEEMYDRDVEIEKITVPAPRPPRPPAPSSSSWP